MRMTFPVCGIDVGIRKSVMAALEGNRLVYLGDPRGKCAICGVDAPLTRGSEPFRDCDREILRMSIRLYPVSMGFMKELHHSALRIVHGGICAYVFEVYPHATRKLLGFGYSKRDASGRRRIEEALKQFVNLGSYRNLNADQLDAITSALTVMLFLEGKARCVGRECRILLPSLVNSP